MFVVFRRDGGAGTRIDAITADSMAAADKRFAAHPTATFKTLLVTDDWGRAVKLIEDATLAEGLPYPPISESGVDRSSDCDLCLSDGHGCEICNDAVGCGHLHEDIVEPLCDDVDLATC